MSEKLKVRRNTNRKTFFVEKFGDWELIFYVFNEFATIGVFDFASQQGECNKSFICFEIIGKARYTIEKALIEIRPDLNLISNMKKALLFEILFHGGAIDKNVWFDISIYQKKSKADTIDSFRINFNETDLGNGDFAKLLQDLAEKQMKEF